MRILFVKLISSVAMVSLLAPNVFAQTTDGQTPAEESVCDPLTADGVSAGLYGLCVAFCEAQDFATADVLLTQTDLEELQNELPSGRILDHYNDMKQASDPGMPCIVEAECPCWTQQELESIDGLGTDGRSFSCPRPPAPNEDADWIKQIVEGNPFHTAAAVNGSEATPPIDVNFCRYVDRGTDPDTFRQVATSPEVAASCLAAVKTQCDLFGL